MTKIERARACARALRADESASSATYHAVLIGLSAAAVLVMVHIGALAAAH